MKTIRSVIFNNDKICKRHNVRGTITLVTSKKWGFRKNLKCFGWITRKTEKMTCKVGIQEKRSSSKETILTSDLDNDLNLHNEAGTIHFERFSDFYKNGKTGVDRISEGLVNSDRE